LKIHDVALATDGIVNN